MSAKKLFPSLIIFLMILPLVILEQACMQKKSAKSEFCTAEDFYKMTKVDMHCHVSVERTAFMEQAVADNFRILTINTDAPSEGSVAEQQQMALFQRDKFPGRLAYLTSFSMEGWDNPEWQKKTLEYLEDSFKKGAIGMKVWKNIGMVEKDKEGKFIMIDNPGFDAIFNYIEKNHIPVCGHLGEPKNCWLPVEEMTVNNDKKYYEQNSQYHMYLHPEYPSYEDQIEARDNLLRKHPDLHFMGAHLGSLEWSVDELGKHFEMFPNMTVDMAARICHLEKQAREDWQKVHDFFIKYQDRIMYGTDQGDFKEAGPEPEKLKEQTHEVWIRDWKFLTTDSIMTSWEVDGEFRGLKLPKDVIEKIYFSNAVKWFPGI
jgi:predicted TIM-barrel fold metal-dependent hydrolase